VGKSIVKVGGGRLKFGARVQNVAIGGIFIDRINGIYGIIWERRKSKKSNFREHPIFNVQIISGGRSAAYENCRSTKTLLSH
jgi:hypothetical protein